MLKPIEEINYKKNIQKSTPGSQQINTGVIFQELGFIPPIGFLFYSCIARAKGKTRQRIDSCSGGSEVDVLMSRVALPVSFGNNLP